VPRGGGGGGASGNSATLTDGGSGGGGSGGSNNTDGTVGSVNTGGGGGAGNGYGAGSIRDGKTGGSGVVIIKIPNTHSAIFTGATFGNNSPDFNNSQPITSVAGFNIYVVSQATAATVAFYENFSADFLVIAGGGGGGRKRGGGGGAGGYQEFTSQTLDVGTAYTVTVGAGGPGNCNKNWQGTARKQFSIFRTTSTGGGGGAGDSYFRSRTKGLVVVAHPKRNRWNG
jgi:hypothetical protein